MNDDKVGLVLDAKTCAEVALYMYEQYKIAPSQRFMYLQFDEWLNKIIKSNQEQ